ncbi:hypothetical protein HMPREF3192_00298 [Atopobium deltae]|uniref:Uncharacterized protein n=1 Tax=Atopobium deltae TaxID=1393034 RepID=A0A133XWP9_9ACTN|nr:hypothetical protein HMPREF3192_00298 [Atopobium deltae]
MARSIDVGASRAPACWLGLRPPRDLLAPHNRPVPSRTRANRRAYPKTTITALLGSVPR